MDANNLIYLLPFLFAGIGGLWTARLTRYKGRPWFWKYDEETREMVPDREIGAGHCKNNPE